MSAGVPVPFEYAVLRLVPRVDRGEFVNVGVILYCQATDYLACRVHLVRERAVVLDPAIDLDVVAQALAGIVAVCAGDTSAGAAAGVGVRARFGWLTAPRSSMVQPGPVHVGITTDGAQHLDHLMARFVR